MARRPIACRRIALALAAGLAATAAAAQDAPPSDGAVEAVPIEGWEAYAFPPPDPQSWWEAERPEPPEAADPLGGRRLPRDRPPPAVTPIEPTLYRLWGLPPLQTQVVRRGELVMEVWRRPSNSVRQSVFRVIRRNDGEVFVQGRAGLACCAPDISRRVGFDAALPRELGDRLIALAEQSAWATPRDVVAQESAATVGSICLEGAAYDLILLTENGGYALRRDCEDAEVGQVGDILEAVIGAGLGHEPRIDVLFPDGADFSRERAAYDRLVAQGGRIKPSDAALRRDGL